MSSATLNLDDVHKTFPIKVELHIHLEGAVRFETILDLAREKNISLPVQKVDELKQFICVRKPEDLTKALENFYIFAPSFAGCHKGVFRVAYELCEDAAKSGIRYMEVRYSPHFLSNSLGVQTYAPTCDGDFTPRQVVETVNKAFGCGSKDFGVTVKSILCCIRHHPEWSWEVMELCAEFKGQGVVAMDIAGPEIGEIVTNSDQSIHVTAFQEARRRGVACIAHAGEAGPANMVRMSVDKLGAVRIGHGYRCLEDESLYQELLKKRIHFEVCPLSSRMTNGAPNGKNHPILRFAKDGANFSINSDDPTLFDNCLADDYVCAMEMGLTKEQIVTSIFNAARASLASSEEKEKLLTDLISVYGKH